MRRCRAHPRRGGFTLLEVLIAMVIAAIAMMMVAPSISSGLRQTHAQQAAATIAQDLRQGLSLAARTRHPVVFALNTDSMVYHLVDRVDGTVYVTEHMGEGTEFSLSDMTASVANVHLLPTGIVAVTTEVPFMLTIQAGESRRRIRLTRAGLIRVEVP